MLFKELFVKKSVFLHANVQVICYKMPVKCLNSGQTYFRQQKSVFLYAVQPINLKMHVKSFNSYQKIVWQKSLCIHAMLCFKMPVKCLYSCQTIVRQKRRIYPSYCTGNMLQKACGKFKFLSNNCLAKKRISPSYCTGNMLQYACEKFVFGSKNCSVENRYFALLLYRQ
jgi:hypothetical protein